MVIIHAAVIIALSFVLSRAAKAVGTHIERIGHSCGVGKFTLSFVFLGFATSMPEISVAVFSSLRGTPELSLGNLLGANIVLLSLLTGLAAVLSGKMTAPSFQRGNVLPLFLAVIALPALAVLDGGLTRVDGVMLIAAHALFLSYYSRRNGEVDGTRTAACRPGPDAMKVLASTAVLLLSSYFLVNSALALAKALDIAPLLIGLLLLSLGTNLPELTFVLTQSKGRNAAIVLGDLFGNALVNTPTLGLLALLSPFTIERHVQALVAAALLAGLLAMFGVLMRTGGRLTRNEGYALLGFYAFFLMIQLELVALT